LLLLSLSPPLFSCLTRPKELPMPIRTSPFLTPAAAAAAAAAAPACAW
jgi:hypothetical protein